MSQADNWNRKYVDLLRKERTSMKNTRKFDNAILLTIVTGSLIALGGFLALISYWVDEKV